MGAVPIVIISKRRSTRTAALLVQDDQLEAGVRAALRQKKRSFLILTPLLRATA